MVQSKAASVDAYLDRLPAERREAIGRVRALVGEHRSAGYREAMAYGMIAWEVPLERYPQTYYGKALVRAALAAQKQYNALYLSCTYRDPLAEALLREAARREGKRLDMGKSCLRFHAPDELPLDAVVTLLRGLSVDGFIASYERARAAPTTSPAKKSAARTPARQPSTKR